MGIKNWQIYFMLIAIGGIIIILLTIPKTSNICELHKELFFASLKNGIIIDKFIDTKNHSFETIIIKENDKLFTLLLVPDSNDLDFERLKINNVITKDSKSFRFKVNNSFEFDFNIDCDFEN